MYICYRFICARNSILGGSVRHVASVESSTKDPQTTCSGYFSGVKEEVPSGSDSDCVAVGGVGVDISYGGGIWLILVWSSPTLLPPSSNTPSPEAK